MQFASTMRCAYGIAGSAASAAQRDGGDAPGSRRSTREIAVAVNRPVSPLHRHRTTRIWTANMLLRTKLPAITLLVAALTVAACSSDTSTPTEPATNASTTVTTAAPSYDPREIGPVVGNAVPALPEGDPGELSVVADSFRYRRAVNITEVYVVVRNNTDGEVRGPEVTVTVRDAAGSPVATATITQMHPHVVAPGGISFGFVEMDDTELPEGAVLDFTVAPADVPEGEDHVVDLPIVEFDRPDTTIRAVVGNDRDTPVAYAEVWVVCFDDTGTLTRTDAGYASPVQIQPGETGTAEVDVAEIECPVYLLSSVAES
jgi:hypothetical protein